MYKQIDKQKQLQNKYLITNNWEKTLVLKGGILHDHFAVLSVCGLSNEHGNNRTLH